MAVGSKADLTPDRLRSCEPRLKCLLSGAEESWDSSDSKENPCYSMNADPKLKARCRSCNQQLALALTSRLAFLLLRRALHISIRTEHATVTCLRFQPCAAAFTLVEVNTCIRRHRFGLLQTAPRTSNRGFENHHFTSGNKAVLSVSNSLFTVMPVASSRSGFSIHLASLP